MSRLAGLTGAATLLLAAGSAAASDAGLPLPSADGNRVGLTGSWTSSWYGAGEAPGVQRPSGGSDA